MFKTRIILAVLLLLLAVSGLQAFYLSSTLPVYVGIPYESDIAESARHVFLLGINWDVYFGGHFGMGVDADFLLGGDQGLKVYGAFFAMAHFNDVWSKPGIKFDPFVGFGLGWTDSVGYYTGTGINATYNATVEFTAAAQVGFNYWFSKYVGLIVKTKFFFNRFEFLQLNAGLNFKLFSFFINTG